MILSPEPGCDVIFTPRTANIPAYLQSAAGMPILTVGETPRFIEQGGIVTFFLENGKVRFEINRSAAERSGLRFSSRLLQLAKIVDPGPRNDDAVSRSAHPPKLLLLTLAPTGAALLLASTGVPDVGHRRTAPGNPERRRGRGAGAAGEPGGINHLRST